MQRDHHRDFLSDGSVDITRLSTNKTCPPDERWHVVGLLYASPCIAHAFICDMMAVFCFSVSLRALPITFMSVAKLVTTCACVSEWHNQDLWVALAPLSSFMGEGGA